MKLEVSDKTGSSFVKPKIKKGYYPGKLKSVEVRKDANGNVFEGQYGNQLIMQFEVHKPDENGAPVEKLKHTFKTETGTNVSEDVLLPKFVYYKYKNKDGSYSSAITPNSAITKILINMGWEFDNSKELDIDTFVGKWVELNIDDYEYAAQDGTMIKASTIKDIGKYEGPQIKESIKDSLDHDNVETIDIADDDLI